jgi:outer membrane protein assembly factor BamA
MGTQRIALLAGALLGVLLLAALVAQGFAQANPPAPPPPAPLFQMESVRVEPPGGEAELLVRRNLRLRPGQMVDVATLVEARRQLAATGLFLEVELYTERGSRPGAITAVVVARPSHHFYLEIGTGRDPLRGSYMNVVSLRRAGLFGHGGSARATFRVARRVTGFYADLDVPALLPRETDLLLNLARYRGTWIIHQGDSTRFQKIDLVRIRIGARHHLTEGLSAALWAGISRADPKQTLESHDDGPAIPTAGVVPVYEDDLQFSEVLASLIRDRQDRLRPWQNGSWAGLVLRGASPRDGERFWGIELEIHRALPVAGTRAAAFRFHAVYTSAETPYFLRPVAGGVGSVRGFPDAGLSGPLGAQALCQVSAEWRHPLVGSKSRSPRVIGTLFADAGDHWDAGGEVADPAAGVGLGALVRIPWLETVNLEAAVPLTDQVKGRPVVIYLSLGRSF